MKCILLFASLAILSVLAVEPKFGKPAGLIPGAAPTNISTFYGRNVQVTTQEASETIIFQNEVNSSIILASSNYFDVEQWTTVVPGLYASLDSGMTWKESFFPQKKRNSPTPNKSKRLPRLSAKFRTREVEDPDDGSIGDPTMEWNSDGTVAYSATLANCEEGCDMWFWKSKDLGKTWIGPVQIDESSMCDKPMLHTDKSSTSPYKDTIYIIYDDPGNGNVQISGYSRDGGQTWKLQTFNYTAGIGGDITTDANGKLYYFYPEFQTNTINFMTSSDGGDTFTNSTPISSTNSSFQMQLPAQDQRGALVYTSVDLDISPNSPFKGSVYVSWSDSWPDANGDHAHLIVAHSRDGGKTWTKVIPHTMSDISTVDRFFQWISVDPKGNGRVHLSFYDTSNWVDRSGVDVYYTYSDDGGVTWSTPIRMSSMSSGNVYWDFDQFGDYEGLSVRHDRVMPIWADNRNRVGPVCIWTSILDTDVLENCKNYEVSFDVTPATIKVGKPITFKAIVSGNTGALNYEWNFSESASVDCSTVQCSWTFHSTNFTQVSLFASEQRTGGCYRGATAFIQPIA